MQSNVAQSIDRAVQNKLIIRGAGQTRINFLPVEYSRCTINNLISDSSAVDENIFRFGCCSKISTIGLSYSRAPLDGKIARINRNFRTRLSERTGVLIYEWSQNIYKQFQTFLRQTAPDTVYYFVTYDLLSDVRLTAELAARNRNFKHFNRTRLPNRQPPNPPAKSLHFFLRSIFLFLFFLSLSLFSSYTRLVRRDVFEKSDSDESVVLHYAIVACSDKD